MGDLISRQAILKHIEKTRHSALMMDDINRASIIMTGMELCEKAVREQPSAQPERKQAKWIVGGIEEDSGYLGSRWHECERCHTPGDLSDKFCRGCGAEMQTLLIFTRPTDKTPNFCPNCGADMRKEKRTAEEAEKKISLLIEDIEGGKGDYKLLPGFYEALAILRGEA